ncbi:inositol 1,4,5-trisphosphate receptor-interacting protein [Siphateles boraxobius]|uniref:inositol 1,4,5-trisphosphate receptor-interacting protein n=1 Tax=Siphateles boraxobius TaxID=180520 RepID=UPI004063559D
MEDTFLHALVFVVSLLLSKDHIVFHDQDDSITVSMRDHELVLLEEGAKLEQGEHAVSNEQPDSDQEVPQNHHRMPRREGDTSDVQQITPNVKTTVLHEEQMSPVGEQNDFRQKAFAPDDQEILDIDKDKWTLHMSKEGLTQEKVNVDQSGSTVDQNGSQGDATQPEKPQSDQIDTHRYQGLFIDQKTPTSSQRLTMITQEKQSSDQEDILSWYLWKILSLIPLFRVFKKFLERGSKPQRKTQRCLSISSVASNIDNKTLTIFHHQCVLVTPSYSWKTCEFVEGFVNDLLETVRNMSTAGSDMEIADFVGVGSLYEQWASKKSIMCDIHIPIIPPQLYSFEFELLKESRGSSTNQYCCKVKMVKSSASSICPCNNSNLDDDMLCLLHPDNKKGDRVAESYITDLLCQENSSYLAKTHVVKWFKTAIKKAWKEISHKYEFELIFQNWEYDGSLKVRFRSGPAPPILFRVTPVVRFKDSEVHLISFLPSATFSDTHWPMCFARYENTLLQHVTKTLPDNACHIHCLQILSFLHKHQTNLTGPCGLTSYHLKNALLHLLVNKPSSWDPEQMVLRLNDLLTFLQQKIKAKVFYHALVGNPLIPTEIGFPKEFRAGKPINLFLPLLNNELYLKTNTHLLEMVRNLPVLIHEYGSVRNVL